MFKEFKKYQIRLTSFDANSSKNLNNIENEDLLLFESVGIDDGEPIDLEYIDYTTGIPIDNYGCQLSIEQQTSDVVCLREGIKLGGSFYPESDPINEDGTFKRVIHSQIKTTFYNEHRNPVKIWGLENLDFEKSKTMRKLSDKFTIYEIPKLSYGDKLVPGTVVIRDDSTDNNYTITDDGFGNLFAQNNLFSHQQEIGDF